MVREFGLVNEIGQEYSLMDIENYCLLTDPSGLGISYTNNYAKVQNSFVPTSSSIDQGNFNGTINSKNYDNFRALVDFIEAADSLRLVYRVPYESGVKEYHRNIKIKSLEKTEKQTTGVISEPISFDLLTLWYEETVIILDGSDIEFINNGHVDATIDLQIDGAITNPTIALYVDNTLKQDLKFTVSIASGEKFLYCTKTNDFYFRKLKTDGSEESLYNFNVISNSDFMNKDLCIRIPKNRKSRIKTNAKSGRIAIFTCYKVV